jgi:hypothetical protein
LKKTQSEKQARSNMLAELIIKLENTIKVHEVELGKQ